MKKKFRVYNIILSDISSAEGDDNFGSFVRGNKWDWWRRTPLNWIICTPIEISTNYLMLQVQRHYGSETPFYVLEIEINDFGGIEMLTQADKEQIKNNKFNPFSFFRSINDPKYVPLWEKSK